MGVLQSHPFLFLGEGVIERFRKRPIIEERNLSETVSISVHDSDPMYVVVIYNKNRPVATEGCIPRYEPWLERAASDAEFLSFIERL
jgi:hypothetical protein